MNNVQCKKLKQELKALENPPFPGELGLKIQNHISEQAWREWLEYQKKLVNENGLDLSEKKTRNMLKDEMIKYLFD
jgi:Fe-S cluster biosynthesis and repair protein YggX